MPRRRVAVKAVLLFALALLGFVYNASAIDMLSFVAAATAPAATSSLYLPTVFHPLSRPELRTPANGSNMSLAPVLSWTLPMTGTYQVQLATDATFATTVLSRTLKYTDASVKVGTTLSSNSNLDEQTTFFWRVGVLFQGTFAYSPVSTFTTPKEDDSLLPTAPEVIGAQPLTNMVTLSWQPVSGALYYRVNIDTAERTGVRTALVEASNTSVKIEGLSPGTAYTWRVRALSATGWSKDTKAPAFTTNP